MDALIGPARELAPFLALLVATVAALLITNVALRKHWSNQPDAQFKFQLIMLVLTLAAVLFVVSALPVSDSLRGQLLSLIGILLSAAIALASATFVGNIMAGMMLKTIRKARPGDFITVETLTGRITEMDLLHTEIQTEFRDLVTVPNSYMVTRPLKVVRASGSIITGEVSLGYDVPQALASDLLRSAAATSGLKDGFVHVRELGDFAVTYRVGGLLEDIHSLISARSRLLSAMLDALHDAGIEIVSPNYMNTRAIAPGAAILPAAHAGIPVTETESDTLAEEIAFDKADDAASAEKLRRAIESTDAEIESAKNYKGDNEDTLAFLHEKKARLDTLLKKAEARVNAEDAEE